MNNVINFPRKKVEVSSDPLECIEALFSIKAELELLKRENARLIQQNLKLIEELRDAKCN